MPGSVTSALTGAALRSITGSCLTPPMNGGRPEPSARNGIGVGPPPRMTGPEPGGSGPGYGCAPGGGPAGPPPGRNDGDAGGEREPPRGGDLSRALPAFSPPPRPPPPP